MEHIDSSFTLKARQIGLDVDKLDASSVSSPYAKGLQLHGGGSLCFMFHDLCFNLFEQVVWTLLEGSYETIILLQEASSLTSVQFKMTPAYVRVLLFLSTPLGPVSTLDLLGDFSAHLLLLNWLPLWPAAFPFCGPSLAHYVSCSLTVSLPGGLAASSKLFL